MKSLGPSGKDIRIMRVPSRGDDVKVAFLHGICKAIDCFEGVDVGDKQAVWAVTDKLSISLMQVIIGEMLRTF